MMEIMGVVRRYVDIPPAVPRTPGPFAFEDLDYLNEIFVSAGFSDVNVFAYHGLQPIGGANVTPQDAVAFVLSSMAVGCGLDEHGDDIRAAAEGGLLDLVQKHYVVGQGVMMQDKAWLVSATA